MGNPFDALDTQDAGPNPFDAMDGGTAKRGPTRASVTATFQADPRYKNGNLIDRALAIWDASAPIRNAPLENPVEATANAFHAAHVALDSDIQRAKQPIKIKRGLTKLIPGADVVEGGNPIGGMIRDVAGMAAAPVTGLINSVYTDPVSKVTGLTKPEVLGALNGLGPGARAAAIAPGLIPERALGTFAAKIKPNLADLEARAGEYRSAGISPTLTDVTDESGRGLIRAAASRMTPARQVAQDFGDTRALNLPDRIARQAASVAPSPASVAAPPDIGAQTTALGAKIAGPEAADAGPMISGAMEGRFNQAQQGVNAAYDTARSASADQAHVPMTEKPVIAANLREAVAGYDPLSVPRVSRELDRIDNLGTVTARDLFEARTRLTNLRMSNDAVEAGAAGKAVRALDGEIDRVEPSMTGEPGAVQSWRAAIASRRAMGQQFEGGDLIHRLTEQVNRGGGMTLAVAPEDAANHIFGRTPLGFIGKPNAVRDIGRLRSVLGPDSPEWKAASGEVYNRLITASTGRDGLDGAKLAANLKRLQESGLASHFFDPGAQSQIADLAANASRPNPADIGARITQPGSDQFVADVSSLTPAERPAAQAAGVRAIQAKAGESTGAAPGLARKIANAPEQQTRTAALFGPDNAGRLQHGMMMEARAVENARQIAPKTGSWTGLNVGDAAALDTAKAAVGAVGKLAGGNPVAAVFDGAKLWLQTRGMSDAEAEALVQIATDPGRTAEAFRILNSHVGRSAARAFMARFKAGLVRLSRPAALIAADANGNSGSPTPLEQGR